MKQLLFLCTGNYYRSRFAEEVFNHHAKEISLNWRADSAGLKVPETRAENSGPISQYSLNAFKKYDIHSHGHEREPKQVSPSMLEMADIVIATSLVEHESMTRDRIPAFFDKITFWDVEDVEFVDPKIALHTLFERTRQLIQKLSLS